MGGAKKKTNYGSNNQGTGKLPQLFKIATFWVVNMNRHEILVPLGPSKSPLLHKIATFAQNRHLRAKSPLSCKIATTGNLVQDGRVPPLPGLTMRPTPAHPWPKMLAPPGPKARAHLWLQMPVFKHLPAVTMAVFKTFAGCYKCRF